MKKGFTMIELIFVIVILGILAAVAIPKLAATRDDAVISKISSNIATLLSDAGAFYTSQGNAKWKTAKWEDVTNVQLQKTASGMADAKGEDIQTGVFLNADASNNCFKIVTTEDGNMTISDGDNVDSVICKGAKDLAANIVKTHGFGGVGIVR